MNITRIDLEELVADWSSIDIDNTDNYEQLLEDWLAENFALDFENFSKLMTIIFKQLDFNISPLTNETFIGLSNDTNWLIKKKLPINNFIGNMILFLTEGEKFKKDTKGFVKTITIAGLPEYNIYICPAHIKMKVAKY